eukprot:TRINITY_DN50809_c0_g1_i1.p1 TRINITY_DN50809_c0_g1~~TRINITY_DN50809_c0_g1_i1.p1  ORF type:complete len:304 (+),score=80.76 TRINITY_DN50809_c0_g1_i1:80-913(+)
MAVRGEFVEVPVGDGSGGRKRKLFRVASSALEVDACSVSSEWSSDSRETPSETERWPSKKRRRVRKWRVAFHTGKPRHLPPELSEAQVEWLGAEKRHRAICVIRGALRPEDIAAAHAAFRNATTKEILDRKASLAYKHRAYRVEMQMRATAPDTYSRLIGLARYADTRMWRNLGSKCSEVYPEMEYIEYDHAVMGSCGIEPHVDNKSTVTMVSMLSHPSEYDGGVSCFRRAQGKNGHRELKLGQGDAVFFRGEKLLHWITPVTRGRRVILQNELSRC